MTSFDRDRIGMDGAVPDMDAGVDAGVDAEVPLDAGNDGGPPIVCGDGVVDAGEACDDDNTAADDGCSPTCEVEDGWSCDDAEPTVCDEICGDSMVVGDEACDDGQNGDDTDGCTDACEATCTVDGDCSALDGECTTGVCDGATGTCSAEPANEGGACDDGNACTEAVCTSGTCGGGTAVVCPDDAPANPCREPTCDPATGCGMEDLADGTSCDDGDLCTTGASTCMGGACMGATDVCEADEMCSAGECSCGGATGASPGDPACDEAGAPDCVGSACVCSTAMDMACGSGETCGSGGCECGGATSADGPVCTGTTPVCSSGACVCNDAPDSCGDLVCNTTSGECECVDNGDCGTMSATCVGGLCQCRDLPDPCAVGEVCADATTCS